MPDQAKYVTTPTALVSAEPQLFVADIRASYAFFEKTLGFTTVFVYGEPPFYGPVKRGGVHLNLRLVCEPLFSGDVRERESLLAASINVENVKALYAEY
jgi:catechol 2,3-dioxygenase-like lactoylglutathione lyase family enzyme